MLVRVNRKTYRIGGTRYQNGWLRFELHALDSHNPPKILSFKKEEGDSTHKIGFVKTLRAMAKEKTREVTKRDDSNAPMRADNTTER